MHPFLHIFSISLDTLLLNNNFFLSHVKGLFSYIKYVHVFIYYLVVRIPYTVKQLHFFLPIQGCKKRMFTPPPPPPNMCIKEPQDEQRGPFTGYHYRGCRALQGFHEIPIRSLLKIFYFTFAKLSEETFCEHSIPLCHSI